jgi:hypothetical protein
MGKSNGPIEFKSPVIKHPQERVNFKIKGGAKYEYGTVLGVSSIIDVHTLTADVVSATNPIPIGMIAAYEGLDLTGKPDTEVVLGGGYAEIDYDEAVKIMPDLSVLTNNGRNTKLSSVHFEVLVTRRKQL